MEFKPFPNRREAGHLLAAKLTLYAHRSDVLVLGLPRGGVPVAYEVAEELGAPLDIILVRKLGVPGEPELAMGAIASGDVLLLNQRVIQALRIPSAVIERVSWEERRELGRRERLYRGDYPEPVLRGRIIIIVDDGIATGSTVRAAVQAAARSQPTKSIVATPVIAAETRRALQAESIDVVCLAAPEDFLSVGSFYSEFPQTNDEEIQLLLGRAWSHAAAHRHEADLGPDPPVTL